MGERGFMELDFDQYKAQQFCDNLDCDASGKIGGNTIRTHSRRHHQVYCNACNPIWVMTKGTFFYNLKAPVSLILEVLKLWLFAIIWAGSKSFHNQLISVFSGCVHF